MNLKSLLADQHLFTFSTRATIKKWKQRTTKHKPTSRNDDIESEDEDDVKILTRAQTPTLARPAAVPPQMSEEILSHLFCHSLVAATRYSDLHFLYRTADSFLSTDDLISSPVTILPPFFTFLTHMTPHVLSFPHHLPMCTQHVPPNHGTYSCLRHTHVHYPICPCPYLVPYGCATASYYIPLTHSSMTHSSPFSTIHLPHLICFLIPAYVIIFHLH